ncbi:MAG: sodium:alanine symporter family protein [Marinilabiliales bacterium]|nr:MAG: sodium:alanine symporter family protein [Marinilabiliales bacterium]
MQKINDFLLVIDSYIGGGPWFVYLLLFTGIFFTLYLWFPQVRYFRHSIRVVTGRYDRSTDVGDTSHFQALTTALSGTVGTGNIAGVALAIHLGGPAALFWMLVTGMFGMTLKLVEVTISHKYRELDSEGRIAGGPMYYMKKRLNITLPNKKVLNIGAWMGAFFAGATILSSIGTGNMPQINSISNAMYATFGIPHIVVGGVLAVLLAFVILGGIKRIAQVTSRLVPAMAFVYILGALAVLLYNYDNIIPSVVSIFSDVFTGSAATGGFLGASIAYAFNRGVNRGLFSNEAGQGSAPIAHSAARAHEPVSEGIVALLEPFIDTICICTLTGLVLLSSGVWHDKVHNDFQRADMRILAEYFDESDEGDVENLFRVLDGRQPVPAFSGSLEIVDGRIVQKQEREITLVHSRSIAEDVTVTVDGVPYSGSLPVINGNIQEIGPTVRLSGRSLIHSAPLTAEAYTRSFFGGFGQYIVSIGLLLFAFSTAISWSYYGDRAVTYLAGSKYVIYYRIVYVLLFFVAAFTDTTIIWTLSYITIAFMTIPNLIGLLLLHKEIKATIKEYWVTFKEEHPGEKAPE